MEYLNNRADRNARADKQEISLVNQFREQGFKSFRVDNKVDVIAFLSACKLLLVDCKNTDEFIFYISKEDINKGLDEAKDFERMGYNAEFAVDMWFPRTREKNHRTLIYLGENTRDCSIRVTYSESNIGLKVIKKE